MIFNSYNEVSLAFGISFLGILIIFLVVFMPLFFIYKKYKKFVLIHSKAINKINEINDEYKFIEIPKYNMEHSYDNKNFYDDISCQDFLTYQLVSKEEDIKNAIENAEKNYGLFVNYSLDVKECCILDQYDTENLLKIKKLLSFIEKREFNKIKKSPTVSFTILVLLKLTNIKGVFKQSKKRIFSSKEILEIISKLHEKKGKFYLNNEIWQSICRVERGKVTNKLRFAIYKRDNYRCKKCGSKKNLEVDHIYPIAKGGKTTFNNLQTLCHRCNVKKGAKVE